MKAVVSIELHTTEYRGDHSVEVIEPQAANDETKLTDLVAMIPNRYDYLVIRRKNLED